MINNVILVGRLTKDIEIRQTTSGSKTTSFTLAVNRKNKQQGQPDADFINCVAWNKTAELMAQYLHKGSLIGVEGRIQTRNYENQQGQRVYVTEVVTDSVQFLEPKNAQSQSSYGNNNYQQPYAGSYNNNQPSYSNNSNSYSAPLDQGFSSTFDENDTLDIASDDLPF